MEKSIISFFNDGNYCIGINYTYTPAIDHKPAVIQEYKPAVIDEASGDIIEEEVPLIVLEEEVHAIPARWNPDCIYSCECEIPPGTRPILEQTKKGYKVTFEPIEIAEEAPPETPTSDNENL